MNRDKAIREVASDLAGALDELELTVAALAAILVPPDTPAPGKEFAPR